jgi:hypothetical protein
MAWPEAIDTVSKVAAMITPFAVLVLGIHASNRKKLMERIDSKIEKVEASVRSGNDECRENVQALQVQLGAFQRDVATDYPKRAEIVETVRELREDIRTRRNDGKSGYDPRRRR